MKPAGPQISLPLLDYPTIFTAGNGNKRSGNHHPNVTGYFFVSSLTLLILNVVLSIKHQQIERFTDRFIP